MEAVNVFAVVDSLYYLLLVDMTRERQLHDESVYVIVIVQTIYTCEQFVFGDVILVADKC